MTVLERCYCTSLPRVLGILRRDQIFLLPIQGGQMLRWCSIKKIWPLWLELFLLLPNPCAKLFNAPRASSTPLNFASDVKYCFTHFSSVSGTYTESVSIGCVWYSLFNTYLFLTSKCFVKLGISVSLLSTLTYNVWIVPKVFLYMAATSKHITHQKRIAWSY